MLKCVNTVHCYLFLVNFTKLCWSQAKIFTEFFACVVVVTMLLSWLRRANNRDLDFRVCKLLLQFAIAVRVEICCRLGK